MAKVLSSGVKVSNQGKNKRKVLQILQISTDEQGITGNMVKPGDKALPSKGKQPKTIEKSKVNEKENGVTALPSKGKQPKSTEKSEVIKKENTEGVTVRRSKRTAATCSSANYSESPELSKTMKPVAKTKKSVKSAAKSKNTVKPKKASTTIKKKEQTKLNQTQLSFSPVAVSTEVKENPTELKLENPEKCISTNLAEKDSGYSLSIDTPDKNPINSTAISNDANIPISVDSEISMITAENPPLSYWKDLAEQRRIALEAALHENELLHDQTTVLEVEISQLKQLLREAEHLAHIVRTIVDE